MPPHMMTVKGWYSATDVGSGIKRTVKNATNSFYYNPDMIWKCNKCA